MKIPLFFKIKSLLIIILINILNQFYEIKNSGLFEPYTMAGNAGNRISGLVSCRQIQTKTLLGFLGISIQ